MMSFTIVQELCQKTGLDAGQKVTASGTYYRIFALLSHSANPMNTGRNHQVEVIKRKTRSYPLVLPDIQTTQKLARKCS
jgi:hypothetical protein